MTQMMATKFSVDLYGIALSGFLFKGSLWSSFWLCVGAVLSGTLFMSVMIVAKCIICFVEKQGLQVDLETFYGDSI